MKDRTRDRLRKAVEGHRETLAEAKSIMTDLILAELTVSNSPNWLVIPFLPNSILRPVDNGMALSGHIKLSRSSFLDPLRPANNER
jgi:hypothetical protein